MLNRLVCVKTVRVNETFDYSKGAEVKCMLYMLIKDAKATNLSVMAKKKYVKICFICLANNMFQQEGLSVGGQPPSYQQVGGGGGGGPPSEQV